MADLSKIKVGDVELSARTANLLEGLTLDQVYEMTDEHLRKRYRLNYRGINEIREVIANVKAQPDPEPAADLQNQLDQARSETESLRSRVAELEAKCSDRLVRLDAALKRAEAAEATARAQFDRAEENFDQLSRMAEAVRPFAAGEAAYPPDWPDGCGVTSVAQKWTLGELRQLAKAYRDYQALEASRG